MTDKELPQAQHLDRRDFCKLAGVGIMGGLSLATEVAAAEVAGASTQPHSATVPPAPMALANPDFTTADILIDALIAWGAAFVFGVVGDGIAPVIEAIRKRQDKIRYIGVRHEEAAAFMAAGYAKLTGKLGVCVGTTDPGAIHLMNGLYDAALDGAPVVAITGITFHDMIGMRYIQAVNTPALMEHVALFNAQVSGPRHAALIGNRACRAAMGNRGVAHLGIPKDVQAMKLSEDKASMNNGDAATSATSLPRTDAPALAQLLIRGSTMPWYEFYPKPGQARCVQVDINPDRIGLRYPVEVGLIGDVKATLDSLLPLLKGQVDRSFLVETQQKVREWNTLLDKVEAVVRTPLRPQMAIRAISDALADDAIITFDCGANTHFAARHLRLRRDQRLLSPGMLDTMAPGLPYAVAAQCAYPGRQVVGIVGDGGFAMLMAELTTAVQHALPIKIFILKNNSLANVVFEQKDAGYGVFGCELSPIDFAAYAKACGADGFRCQSPEDLRSIIPAALRSPRPAIIEIEVDPAEKPELPAHVKV